MVTSVTFRGGIKPGDGARFASEDGSLDLTNDSELPFIESIVCGSNEELIDSSGFGGGVGDDFLWAGDVGRGEPGRGEPGRGEPGRGDAGRDVLGRSPGFGDIGRTYGSGFAAGLETNGACTFTGGGGIIPLP